MHGEEDYCQYDQVDYDTKIVDNNYMYNYKVFNKRCIAYELISSIYDTYNYTSLFKTVIILMEILEDSLVKVFVSRLQLVSVMCN